jgi:hypothetical protein
MRFRLRFLRAAGFGFWLSVASQLPDANCALRNPDRQIYETFREATSYRTVVANVDAKLKPLITRRLSSELSFTDLGKHAVYLVLNEGVPIGIVHARTEIGRRGSVELAWALDLDLNVKDFRVQRSRDKHRNAVESDAFRVRLVGRDFKGLLDLLSDDLRSIDRAVLSVPDDPQRIAHTVVLSGLKTRAITEMAFERSVLQARLLGNVHRFFPTTHKVTRLNVTYGQEMAATIERSSAGRDQIDRLALTVLRAVDEAGGSLGSLVFSRWSAHPATPECWFAVSPDGTIRKTLLIGDVMGPTRDRAASLAGMDFNRLASRLASSPASMPAGKDAGCADLRGRDRSTPDVARCGLELERPDVRPRALADPSSFLEEAEAPVILDEIQYAPHLLHHIKDLIDESRTPGRWLLAGSQSFSLMRGVGQTLAGRVAVLTLDPLSVAESRKFPAAPSFDHVLRKAFGTGGTRSSSGKTGKVVDLANWLLRGGSPQVCVEQQVDRQIWFPSYVQTYLERDVRDLAQVGDLTAFTQFVMLVASHTGQILNMTELGRRIGVTGPTAKRWLSVLEASQVIYLLPPFHRNFGKRIRRSPKLYLLDTGLATFLLGLHTKESVLQGPSLGALAETTVVSEWVKTCR